MNLGDIKKVKLLDNREHCYIIYGHPIASNMSKTKIETNDGWGVRYELKIHLETGYTMIFDISESLYDSLSETKKEGGE